MVTLGYDSELISELKNNWTIGIDADVTIASINQDNFWNKFCDSNSKSLYKFFDEELVVQYMNKNRQEVPTGSDLELFRNSSEKISDLPTFSDTMLEIHAPAFYNKISPINSNITLEMGKTSYGDDKDSLFQIDQFYKIDLSTNVYECFVNPLGILNMNSRLTIGNHALAIEERNDLRGRTLKVARLKTYTNEDSSIYTIFMNFLAASLNAR